MYDTNATNIIDLGPTQELGLLVERDRALSIQIYSTVKMNTVIHQKNR